MSAQDYFVNVGDPGSATTLDVDYTVADTSVTVVSTTNWPAVGEAVVFAIDEATVVDGQEVQTAGTYNEFEGTVASATSITNVDWKRGSGDRNYTAGSLTRVYIPVSAERENRLVTGILVEHNQDGTHDFSGAWTSHTSNPAGWSTLGTNIFYYQKVGKIVFCRLHFSGTSNATTASFTLPFANTSNGGSVSMRLPIGYSEDNGSANSSTAVVTFNVGGSTASIYKTPALGAWTATNTKTIIGSFFYEAA